MKTTGNWLQHGRRIDPPLGYQIEDYFRDGRYLGPDADGIAPELSGLASTHAHRGRRNPDPGALVAGPGLRAVLLPRAD